MEKSKKYGGDDQEHTKFETMLAKRLELMQSWHKEPDTSAGAAALKDTESKSGVAGVSGLLSRSALEALVSAKLTGSTEAELQEAANLWGTAVCPGVIDPAKNMVGAVKTALGLLKQALRRADAVAKKAQSKKEEAEQKKRKAAEEPVLAFTVYSKTLTRSISLVRLATKCHNRVLVVVSWSVVSPS